MDRPRTNPRPTPSTTPQERNTVRTISASDSGTSSTQTSSSSRIATAPVLIPRPRPSSTQCSSSTWSAALGGMTTSQWQSTSSSASDLSSTSNDQGKLLSETAQILSKGRSGNISVAGPDAARDYQPPEEPQVADESNYSDILKKFSEKWLMIQINHEVSVKAASLFWEAAMEFFPSLYEAKLNDQAAKKSKCFSHIRQKMYKESCPKVTMKYGFLNKDTDEIELVVSETAHKFDRSKYKKLFEEAHVEVNTTLYFDDN